MTARRRFLPAMICADALAGCTYVLPRPMTPAPTGSASAPSAEQPPPAPPLCGRTSQPCRRLQLSGR